MISTSARIIVSLTVLIAFLAGGGLWLHFKPTVMETPEVMQSSTPVPSGKTRPVASYIGRQRCADCHTEQHRLWLDSHHDLAMQTASKDTVLGDFNNTEFTYFETVSTFFRDGERFMVRTDGPDGEPGDYEIKYTFGVNPLQQYLIEFPGNRLQVLGIAWDARPILQGGQRWFHLYPDENITHENELHWTRHNQNWNSMCAECHSTHLEKNFSPALKTFETTWSEIDVSCEACHGQGSDHITWAERKPGWEHLESNKGLAIQLDERINVRWQIQPDTGNALRSRDRDSEREIEMCARCHSRRSPVSADYVHGEPLLDHYRPRLLDEGLYHADGQLLDEVYVYGSFIQSKMYQAGVTCSDCHDPHSLDLRQPGNLVCLQCHEQTKYNIESHHFHKAGSEGTICIECHMPAKIYMGVDPRHDHSIRIPRPDLSVKLGTPNACNQCHKDRDAEWAAQQVNAWYRKVPAGYQQYAEALTAGRRGGPGGGRVLKSLIRDTTSPGIARASAISEFAAYLTDESLDVLQLGLVDKDPNVRAAALNVLQHAPYETQARMALPLLDDPVRAVRIEAAYLIAMNPAAQPSKEQETMLNRGILEYIALQEANAERPEAQHNLGNVYAGLGKIHKAEAAYQAAIELDPGFIPAYINLADLYRQYDNDPAGERLLRQAVEASPGSGAVHHALGLLLVRQKRREEAVAELKQAARLDPDNAHYLYVHAVALDSIGKPDEAVLALREAHNRHPGDPDILSALVTLYDDMGNLTASRTYADKLRALVPQGAPARE